MEPLSFPVPLCRATTSGGWVLLECIHVLRNVPCAVGLTLFLL